MKTSKIKQNTSSETKKQEKEVIIQDCFPLKMKFPESKDHCLLLVYPLSSVEDSATNSY